MFYYKNRSPRVQTINLNTGRSLHVQAGEEVPLTGDEHLSDEIEGKVRGSRASGVLRDDSVSSKKEAPGEVSRSVKTSDRPYLSPREGERG
jgi:hypothetical protein